MGRANAICDANTLWAARMRYEICEYAMCRANAIREYAMGPANAECDMRYAIYGGPGVHSDVGSAAGPQRVRSGSAAGPQWVRSGSAVLPHRVRSTSAVLPQRVRTTPA